MNFAPKFCRSLVSRCIIAACLSFLPVLLCTSQFHARILMAVICAVTFMGCEKDEQESFKFDIENLYGTWQGIAIQSNGEWIDITQPPHTNLAFSVVFYENGTYSGSGYFGNGSGTYKAEGDMIYTYIDGEELYRYKVHSISNGIAEVSMGVAGDNITLEIKLQKK